MKESFSRSHDYKVDDVANDDSYKLEVGGRSVGVSREINELKDVLSDDSLSVEKMLIVDKKINDLERKQGIKEEIKAVGEVFDDDSVSVEEMLKADQKIRELEQQLDINPNEDLPSKENEVTETVSDEIADPEENVELRHERSESQTEHLRLKLEFKKAEGEYYDAIEADYAERGFAKKLFGLGRTELSPEVQAARDSFMVANKEYYAHAQNSGIYKKISERLNRDLDSESEGEVSVAPVVNDRHVLNPAKQRLELQSSLLPEKVRDLKQSLTESINLSPSVAKALGYMAYGYSAYRVFNMPAALAGMGVNHLADIVASYKEEGAVSTVDDAGENNNFDLDKLEDEYFKNIHTAQAVRTTGKIGAVAATAAVGGAFDAGLDSPAETLARANEETPVSFADSLLDSEKPDTVTVNGSEVLVEDSSPNLEQATDPAVESKDSVEVVHVVERGNNVSSILFETINNKIISGEYVLPEGVNEDSVSHYIYQQFPELTNASDVEPKMTPEEWMEAGIKSGDPQKIAVGEQIDISILMEKLSIESVEVSVDVPVETSLEVISAEPASTVSPVEATISDKDDVLPSSLTKEVGVTKLDVDYDLGAQSESLSDLNNSEFKSEIDAVKALDYTPRISAEYLNLTQNFNGDFGELHKKLAETIHRGYSSGAIDLPDSVADNIGRNWTSVFNFVESHIPKVSVSLFDWGEPAVTENQWKEFGISSGNPKDIVPTDVVKIGEIISFILEKADEENASLQTDKLEKMVDNLPPGSTPEMIAEFRSKIGLSI